MTLNVREEVEKLLAEMRAKVLTVDQARATVEVSAIARRAAIPDVDQNLIPAYARATLLGAWVQYDIQHRY